MAGYMKLGARDPRPHRPSALRAAVIAEARRRGICNQKLDQMAGTGSFFYGGQSQEGVNCLLAAADVLGLKIKLVWQPLRDD